MSFQYKYFVLALSLLIYHFEGSAQERISLQQCVEGSLLHNGVESQKESVDYITSAERLYLRKIIEPELSAFFVASYQSDVPDPNSALEFGFDFNLIAKDQYRSGVLLRQLIYGGGEYKLRREYSTIRGALLKNEIEQRALGLQDRVEELFFAILLLEKSNSILKSQIELQRENLSIASSLFLEGRVAVVDSISAEIALEEAISKGRALSLEIERLKKVLSTLTGVQIGASDFLEEPHFANSEVSKEGAFEDPLFERARLEGERLEYLSNLSTVAALPKLSLFAVGGYARPALDFYNNSPDLYGVVGLSLKVPITEWRDQKRYKSILLHRRRVLESSFEASKVNRNCTLAQIDSEIIKAKSKVEDSENQLIKYRKLVKRSTELFSKGELSLNQLNQAITLEYGAKISLERDKLEMLRHLYKQNKVSTPLIYSHTDEKD